MRSGWVGGCKIEGLSAEEDRRGDEKSRKSVSTSRLKM